MSKGNNSESQNNTEIENEVIVETTKKSRNQRK